VTLVATAPKAKPAKAAANQNTSKPDWESNTTTDLRPPIEAARDNFLSDADRLRRWRLQAAIRAFRQNRFAPAAGVLKPCLDGWIELHVGGDLPVGLRGVPLVQLAINYFGTMLAIAEQNREIIGKPVPWAESQTRSALNQVFGTKWFSTPGPENKAESHIVNSWLREIDETVFVPRPLPDPALKDKKAILQQWLTWQGHGWLATWLPCSTPALSLYVDRPFEPLLQEVQDYVVEDITSYLFHGVEDRLKRAVNIAHVEHACSKTAKLSQKDRTKPITSRRSDEESFRKGVIFKALDARKTGLDYCDFLGKHELTTPKAWQLDGCPESYALAYQEVKVRGRKYRAKIYKEKSRYRVLRSKLERENPAELRRIFAIADKVPRL
jgi:hypothetical protein